MDLEMVLNELSLRTPAADIPTAQQLMSELIGTVRQATSSGVKRVLRTSDEINTIELAPGYPVARWRNDATVNREERSFFRTLTAKAPFWTDVAEEIKNDFDLSQVWHQGEEARGLGFAVVIDGLVVSLISEARWDCSRLELEIRRLDENEELIDEPLEIIHASRSNHVQEHSNWINNRIRSTVVDGLELWNRKDELFPNLIFCEAVREQLQNLGAKHPMLHHVKNKLSEIEGYCKIWTDEAFGPKSLKNVSVESPVTLQNPTYSKERMFLCPDGQKQVFSWHAKLSFGWRIYFLPNEQRRMIIGYVGCHLRTVKYSN
ncbi:MULTISPECIES: hypothetical protein [Cyanophyceae]|uniref:hypothetical protein n=1 Tax=Cyanophyceae TaxID=3028117 RepID=UPI001685F20B|nr:hypothetical protein [Trichocoleus sp. FACHB-69]MBD1932032.1 hypothetical protein [Trichocoleus sp. FACHB-69]